MDKMKMESVNMTEQNIERIGELFPNCITEMLDEEKVRLTIKFIKSSKF